MIKIHQEKCGYIYFTWKRNHTPNHPQSDRHFHDQSVKHNAQNQQPLSTKNLLLHNVQQIEISLFFRLFVTSQISQPVLQTQISQLEARLIKKDGAHARTCEHLIQNQYCSPQSLLYPSSERQREETACLRVEPSILPRAILLTLKLQCRGCYRL